MELMEQSREWHLKDTLHVSLETVRSRSRMSFKLKSELELAKEIGAGREMGLDCRIILNSKNVDLRVPYLVCNLGSRCNVIILSRTKVVSSIAHQQ